ncbi:MAG: ABC transporter substrate-binding protein [Chloroflexota bacterium]
MKKLTGLTLLALMMIFFITACGSAEPEVVEVTRVVVETEEVEVTRIVETQIVRVAFPSSIDIDDVVALLAFEKMQDEGFAVAPTFYAQGELAAAAVASGQADFGMGSSTVWLSAILAGAEIKGVMEQAANGWSVMGLESIESCEDIGGMRTAIHSEGSVSTAMLRAYIGENCPGTEPNYLVIPGSENRAAALMAGEIDVTPAELIDSIRVQALQPGEFHRIANFATDLSGLRTSGYWVSQEFAQSNPEAMHTFIRNVLEVHRQVNEDPEWFIEQVPRFLELEDEDIALLPEIVDALLAIDSYPVNGGLSLESGQFTIDFFTDAGRLDAGLTAEQAYDLSYLDAVLAEIGEQ